MNNLNDVAMANSQPNNHQFYFDYFFTSYDLMKELRERKVSATGTFRDCRTFGAVDV